MAWNARFRFRFGLGCRIQCLELRMLGLGFRAQGSGLKFRTQKLGPREDAVLGFRIRG